MVGSKLKFPPRVRGLTPKAFENYLQNEFDEVVIDRRQAEDYLNISRVTVWRQTKEGKFPAGFTVGSGMLSYFGSELVRYLYAKSNNLIYEAGKPASEFKKISLHEPTDSMGECA